MNARLMPWRKSWSAQVHAVEQREAERSRARRWRGASRGRTAAALTSPGDRDDEELQRHDQSVDQHHGRCKLGRQAWEKHHGERAATSAAPEAGHDGRNMSSEVGRLEYHHPDHKGAGEDADEQEADPLLPEDPKQRRVPPQAHAEHQQVVCIQNQEPVTAGRRLVVGSVRAVSSATGPAAYLIQSNAFGRKDPPLNIKYPAPLHVCTSVTHTNLQNCAYERIKKYKRVRFTGSPLSLTVQ